MKSISQQAAADHTSRTNVWRRIRDGRLCGRQLADRRWVICETAAEVILIDALEPAPVGPAV